MRGGGEGQMNPKLLPFLISIQITKYYSSNDNDNLYCAKKPKVQRNFTKVRKLHYKNKGVKYVQKNVTR